MTQHKATTTRLDIAGFKSFADEIRLDILPGLTGIVGPNGCGKSNIVEALRWTMGESSARALRGGESDDLIFAGTGSRPARNLARVTLHLAEAAGLAPPPFQQASELEVSRQAERGSGSTYRINNRVMRARDVQTVFADLSSGARSSSIISQNRVSQLIAAKPEERRLLLEEAAGITGLHVRRRDAELKLRQAESNLERAEEHRQVLAQQLDTLAGQSEKARNYRTASEDIRQHEQALLVLQHARADQLVQTRHEALLKARRNLEKSESALREAQEKLATQASGRQALEKQLAALRPRLEQHRIHIEVAQASLQHRRQAAEDHTRQKSQLEADISRQKEDLSQLEKRRHETRQALEELREKQEDLQAGEPELVQQVANLKAREREEEEAHAALAARYQEGRLQRERLQSQLHALTRQIDDDRRTLAELKTALHEIEENCTATTPANETRQAVAQAGRDAAEQEKRARKADARFQEERLADERARRDLQDARNHLEHIRQREQELTSSLARQQERLEQNRTQAARARAQLLDENRRTALHQAAEQARQQTEQAVQVVKEQTLQREKAEQLWLEEQAEQEKHQQRHTFLQAEIKRLKESLAAEHTRCETARKALEEARQQAITHETLEAAQQALVRLDGKITTGKDEISQASESLATLLSQQQAAQAALQETESELLRHEGEHAGLKQSLQSVLQDIPHPVMEQLHIPDALARAVASALTDGLEASLPPAGDTMKDTPRQWRTLTAAHPEEARDDALAPMPSLKALIETPAPLARAFSAILLLDDPAKGPALQPRLLPGQALVTRDGGLWRWDGFIRQPNTPTAEMIRLQQVKNLQKTEADITRLTRQRDERRQHVATLQQERDTAERSLAEQRQQLESQLEEQARQRHQLEGLQQRHALQQEQLALLQNEATAHADQQARLEEEHDKAVKELDALAPLLAGPPSHAGTLQELRQKEQQARQALEATRTRQQEAETRQQQALFQHNALTERLQELEQAMTRLEEDQKQQERQKQSLLEERTPIDLAALQERLDMTGQTLRQARQESTDTARQAEAARQEATRQEQALQEQTHRLAGLQARRDSLAQQLETCMQALATHQKEEQACQQEQANLPDMAQLELTLGQTAEKLDTTRKTLRQQLDSRNELLQALSLLKERQEHVQADRQQQEQQLARLQTAIRDLETRHAALMETAPAQMEDNGFSHHEEQLQQDVAALGILEKEEKTLSEQLAGLLAQQQEQQLLLEHHTESSNQHREEGIRLAERAEQAEEALALLRHDAPLPDNAPPPETVSAEAEQALKQALKRAMKRRDDLGPVNLCAEDEFHTAQEEAERIAQEHQDLSTAIARLRGGVGAINREGRQRLMAVFADINEHFQKLFIRMFGGGKAHLQMVGSDDPLEAGLEIFAQPPGKKLSTLSLLSGGEQALTALSLIFAAFHCTPAPICVLDEVDAPLDDANVERFCILLRDMTRKTGTRFLIVTHHQLTMAHMDRLYGITMQERGVSRLLSVNLDESIRMVNG